MTDAASSIIAGRESIDGGVLVTLRGEINFDGAPVLRNELVTLVERDGISKLVLDLAQVEYMDSSGLAALVEVMQIQRRRGKPLVLCAMQSKVQGIFEIARLDTIFTIVPDRQAALDA